MTVKENVLDKILNHKKEEVAQAKAKVSLKSLQAMVADLSPTHDFAGALKQKIATKKSAVIAEIKKASPSAGVIRENFDPIAIAKSYEKAQAACLSILTDENFFKGHNDYLTQVRAITNLPILRKDFIVDEYQIYQARAIGADCILLIAAALDDNQLQEFSNLAASLKMSTLFEVHDLEELNRVLALPSQLIGINNRNLKTFDTSLNTSIELAKQIPKDRIVIAESGINNSNDIRLLQENNIYTYLIGESFMRATDPGAKLKELLNYD